jgi:hypothetical protein
MVDANDPSVARHTKEKVLFIRFYQPTSVHLCEHCPALRAFSEAGCARVCGFPLLFFAAQIYH